jgi:hypothetical protein
MQPFDTIVVPAQQENFQKMFIDGNYWHHVRIAKERILKRELKFIAVYQVAPVAAITHIAEIADFIKSDSDPGKYVVHFKAAATAIRPIVRLKGSRKNIQRSCYTSRERLLAAKTLDEVFK